MKFLAKCNDDDKHGFDVNSLIMHKKFVYSGADDGKIIKWDDQLKKIGEVQAHPCSIYSVAAIDDTVYSCSNDGTVKAWTLDLQPKGTIVEETGEFWKLIAADGVLYAGDDVGTVRKIVNGKQNARFEILEGIKDLAVSGETLYSGKDCDIVITTMGHLGPNKSFVTPAITRNILQGRAPLLLAGDKLVFVDIPAMGFVVHDNHTESNFKQIATVLGAHTMIINALAGRRVQSGKETVFYTGSWDKTVKKWRIMDGKCEQLDDMNIERVVTTLLADELREAVYVGMADGYIAKIA